MKAIHSRVISEPPPFGRNQVERVAGAPSWVGALESVAARLLPSLAPLSSNQPTDATKAKASLVLQDLHRGEVHRFDAEDRVEEIHVLSGIVWLTETPAKGDVILRPLDSYRLSGACPVVLEALAEASIVSARRRC